MIPTEEQEAIREATRRASESLMIDAYAGVGKTTTLTLAAPGVKVPALAVAFNVGAKNALAGKFPSNFKVQTMNGLGFGALGRAMPGKELRIDDRKVGRIITETSKQWRVDLGEEGWALTKQLVRRAQLAGIVPDDAGDSPLCSDDPSNWALIAEDLWIPEDESEQLIGLAHEVLVRSNEEVSQQGVITFDDQIYYSTCVAGRFGLFPVLMVDEAQDLSPLMHAMLAKSLRPDGRLIAVGDQRQSIYAFRGADVDSLRKIRALRGDWMDLPLATTFRCPKVIVRRQAQHARGFKAAESAPEGAYERLQGETLTEGWNWKHVMSHVGPSDSLAVLCRNNAPLIKMAFKLIRQRVPVQMAGRDIGQGLIALSKKLWKDNDTSVTQMSGELDDWEQTETSKAAIMNQEEKISGITDRAESLRAVMTLSEVSSAEELRKAIEMLFAKDSGLVTLSTIHRAKGLEWDVVLHLDSWRVPSKMAKESGDPRVMQQEMNLVYVAETRTKRVLLHGSLEEFR